LGGFRKLGGRVGVVLPGVKNGGGFLTDAIDSHQTVLGCTEDGGRIAAKSFQQTPHPDRADFRQQVESC